MPADHLTVPNQLAAGIRAVLAGADLNSTATDCAVDPIELDQAAQTYHAAGLAALEQRAEHAWYQVHVEFPDWPTAEAIGATQLGPRLDLLQVNEELRRWWFLRKHPCWRLRLHDANSTAVNQLLDELTATGTITRWWPTIYEPETAAFGGLAGMDIIHDLFCADSRGALNYLRHNAPGLGRRELSLLLINGLLHAAGLDPFERGDVFHRVGQLRPAPSDAHAARIDQLTDKVRVLLAISDPSTSDLFTSGGPAATAAPWLAAFQTTGRRLCDAAARGRLNRGIRAILTHVVIFHWNRVGLSAISQGILASAASAALLSKS